jgi:hypothetical protein
MPQRYRDITAVSHRDPALEHVMTTPASLSEPPDTSDPVRLLVHAVGQLPADQRDLVLTWLLRQRPTVARHQALRDTAQQAELLMRDTYLEPVSRSIQDRAGSLTGVGATGQQAVPVRFPADQHAELRAWCTEHGFSMATVIRGLVARFLDHQRSAGDPAPG